MVSKLKFDSMDIVPVQK